jgi:hypothetical protein
MIENAGIISEANPSEMKYTDTYGNICTWYVDCPEALSKLIFFLWCDHHPKSTMSRSAAARKPKADKIFILSPFNYADWN